VSYVVRLERGSEECLEFWGCELPVLDLKFLFLSLYALMDATDCFSFSTYILELLDSRS
jgi:hypothetical protein